MYSREEKLKAVELFIKYDKSPASAIRELGYPCRATLYAWHEEYLASGCRAPSTSAHRRYTEDQKRAVVDHFFERICQLNSGPRFALKAGHSHCLQSASSSSCWSSLSTPSSR